MLMDSGTTDISPSDSMPYMTAASLEMSDEPNLFPSLGSFILHVIGRGYTIEHFKTPVEISFTFKTN